MRFNLKFLRCRLHRSGFYVNKLGTVEGRPTSVGLVDDVCELNRVSKAG